MFSIATYWFTLKFIHTSWQKKKCVDFPKEVQDGQYLSSLFILIFYLGTIIKHQFSTFFRWGIKHTHNIPCGFGGSGFFLLITTVGRSTTSISTFCDTSGKSDTFVFGWLCWLDCTDFCITSVSSITSCLIGGDTCWLNATSICGFPTSTFSFWFELMLAVSSYRT